MTFFNIKIFLDKGFFIVEEKSLYNLSNYRTLYELAGKITTILMKEGLLRCKLMPSSFPLNRHEAASSLKVCLMVWKTFIEIPGLLEEITRLWPKCFKKINQHFSTFIKTSSLSRKRFKYHKVPLIIKSSCSRRRYPRCSLSKTLSDILARSNKCFPSGSVADVVKKKTIPSIEKLDEESVVEEATSSKTESLSIKSVSEESSIPFPCHLHLFLIEPSLDEGVLVIVKQRIRAGSLKELYILCGEQLMATHACLLEYEDKATLHIPSLMTFPRHLIPSSLWRDGPPYKEAYVTDGVYYWLIVVSLYYSLDLFTMLYEAFPPQDKDLADYQQKKKCMMEWIEGYQGVYLEITNKNLEFPPLSSNPLKASDNDFCLVPQG